jgi:hypothetical protein
MDGSQLSGFSRLLSPSGKTMLLLNLYCYVQPLANTRLLIWYEVAKWDAPRHPRIVFTLIDLRMLEVLDDPPATAKNMKASKERVYFRGGDAVFCEFSTTRVITSIACTARSLPSTSVPARSRLSRSTGSMKAAQG